MLWYFVAPFVDEKWNVLFEDQPRPYIYDDQEAATKAAHKAAKETFDKNGTPAGVKVKEGDRWRDDGVYGEE
jgi:hypothetical protein